VAGSRTPLRSFGRGKIVKSVRLNHLRAALLAVVAAGLLAAVGVVAVLYAQPAEANYPGKPGKIAYAGEDGTDLVIYTIKPDGGGKVPLIANGTNREPAYSPNGKRIAYSASDGNDYEIYTINANGGGKKQLTDNSTADNYPYYSPSGKRIAYSGIDTGPGNDYEIFTINAGGGGKLNVTDNSSGDYDPAYSPSGKRIAFEGKDGNESEIYTIQTRRGRQAQRHRQLLG
jgi:Tol biopolymer transport system component